VRGGTNVWRWVGLRVRVCGGWRDGGERGSKEYVGLRIGSPVRGGGHE